MKALLLVAHGSRNPGSNDEIHALTGALRRLAENASQRRFEIIDCAFLELAEPDIESAIGDLVRQGATEITVLPYFLAKGNHIIRDVPGKILNAQRQFPDLVVKTVPHIGEAANMLNLLLEHVNRHIA